MYGGNISDVFFVCGTTNVVITSSLYFFCHINFLSVEWRTLLYRCMGTQYIRCRIIGLWNDECCYTGVWGQYTRWWDFSSAEWRMLLYRCMGGNISDAGLLVCGTTNVVITGSLYFFCHINFWRKLLYRCMGTQYIRCRIIGLWNNERCYNRLALLLLSY